MEKIEAENLLHRAFSVFLFNSKYELLLQVGGKNNSLNFAFRFDKFSLKWLIDVTCRIVLWVKWWECPV